MKKAEDEDKERKENCFKKFSLYDKKLEIGISFLKTEEKKKRYFLFASIDLHFANFDHDNF